MQPDIIKKEKLPEMSVIIIQYNPQWEKIKRTIKSIAMQKDCDFEVIISDDGSKEDLFMESKKLLNALGMVSYAFVKSKENGGTVNNVIQGLERARGKYVRVIAPGDCLYAEDTLCHICNFMRKNNAKETFGKIAGYSEERNYAVNVQIPLDTSIYNDKKDVDVILKHLLEYSDNISGASYSWEREYYLECLKKIQNKVRFLEDCANVFTILDGYEIHYMDEYVTLYEMGTGISTNGDNMWLGRLKEDWLNFYEVVEREYPRCKNVHRAKRIMKMQKKKSLFWRIIKTCLYLDVYLYYKRKREKEEQVISCNMLKIIGVESLS